MARIAFVHAHTKREPLIEPREDRLASHLREMGHEVHAYGMCQRKPGSLGAYASFFLPDNPSDPSNELVSAELIQSVVGAAPDLVLIKGLGFSVIAPLIEALDGISSVGAILGGSAFDRRAAKMDVFLVEFPAQIEDLKVRYKRQDALFSVMPKFLPWQAINSAPRKKRYDVSNVGNMIPRKNQMALAPLFGSASIVFVGGGKDRTSIEAAAKGHDVTFTGVLKHEQVVRTIAESRVLVHASTWEGLPRVIIEAAAVGVPAIGLRATLEKQCADLPFVLLAESADELCKMTLDLLGDQRRLDALSSAAETYAKANHSPECLSDIAALIDRFVRETDRPIAAAT